MEIEREWSRTPGWFLRQTPDRRRELLAWWRTKHLPAPEAPPTSKRGRLAPTPVKGPR